MITSIKFKNAKKVSADFSRFSKRFNKNMVETIRKGLIPDFEETEKMLFKSKRGKAPDASAAAAFIAIIAALIVLYILVLPPEEREEILGEDEEVEEAVEEEKAILLSVSPKRISPPEEKEFEQDLPTVNIQVGEEGVELKRIDSLYVKRSLFTSKDYGINFNIGNIRDIRRLKNIRLSAGSLGFEDSYEHVNIYMISRGDFKIIK